MRYSFIRLAFCALLAVAPGLAGAATIHVPEDYPTIQGAVDAAATNGDTIEVAAGTYNVTQVKIAYKSLTLHGAGAATTIIDGGRTPGIWYSGTVIVWRPTGPVLVEGFTIREAGTGTDTYIECLTASDFEYPVTVRNCHFIGHNHGDDWDMGAYGASGHEEGRFIVENCEFEKMWQAILMERMTAGCSILNNNFHHLLPAWEDPTLYEAEGVFFMTYGGALFDANGLVEVSGNRFTDFVGSDIIIAGGYGPDEDTSKVNHVEIKDNRIEAIGSGPERRHAGIVLVNYGDDPEEAAEGGVHNALVTGNVLTGTGGADSYGIRIWGWCSNINACGNAISSLDWGLIVEEKVHDAGCATGVAAHYNNIVGNTTGIQNDSPTDTVDAEYNWWGATDGPSGVGPGSGDAVSTNVDYDPWCTAVVGKTTTYIRLEGVTPDVHDRTIQVLFGAVSAPTLPLAFSELIEFSGGLGQFTTYAPLGRVSVKDEQHTLCRRVCSHDLGGGVFEAYLTGGNQLLGGDLNNDNVCDIWDYGILAAQYGPPPPLTGFNADINLDNRVWKQDLVILYAHYLTPGCLPCDQTAVPTPVSRITIAQLAAIVGGLANARKADMDHNNIINTTDLRVFYTRNICVR